MTKAEFDAIKARAQVVVQFESGDLRMVVTAIGPDGKPVNPATISEQCDRECRALAEQIAYAMRDRAALVHWIDDSFDVDWFDSDTPAATAPQTEAS